MFVGETTLRPENAVPQLVEVAFFELFLGRWLDIGVLIAGIILTTLGGVEKNFGSLLNTLEKAVVFVALAGSSLLVGVMAEDLLAVGTLDLFGGSLVAVFAKTEDGVVILALLIISICIHSKSRRL